jgi:hypothetical protein
VRPTTVIAGLATYEGARDVASVLRANGIEYVVDEPSNPRWGAMGAAPRGGDQRNYFVFVAKEDEARAREALQGVLASKWFLLTPEGEPYHSFEAATVDLLRSHVSRHPAVDDWSLREVAYLADEMQRHGWKTVYEAFHERHLLREHERLVDVHDLDEWARLCGCGKIHHAPEE